MSLYRNNDYLIDAPFITKMDKEFWDMVGYDMDDATAAASIKFISELMSKYYEKKVLIFLDEYDTPIQEAYTDGFKIGKTCDIYNPWSIKQYLDTGVLDNYWANTSENSLVEKLIREGSSDVKRSMETLLSGKPIEALIDDEIVFNLIDKNESGIYSLLLSAGYLKIDESISNQGVRKKYLVSLTNLEVKHSFEDMIKRWFEGGNIRYNDFVKALLTNDIKYMNRFMNDIALNTFSSFDTGNKPSEKKEPERFYHGFVLGLMVDLSEKYSITSNRESGFGRYDVCLEPIDKNSPAYILEFKVHDPDEEKTLEDTVKNALKQIKDKKYDASLFKHGINASNIFHYGFAFEGKNVLIG